MALQNYQNIVTSTRKECSQLYFIFTGVGGQLLLMSPFEFLQKTDLATRNFVVFKDPHLAGYQRGLSRGIPDLESLYDWQRRFILEHPHISDVFCIGVSAGAIPAITAGHRLGAKTVWSFSARSPSDRWRTRYGGPQSQRTGIRPWLRGQLKKRAVQLRKLTNRTAQEKFAISMIDVELINKAAAQLGCSNGQTEYRLYYCPSNLTDAFVHSCLANCPAVSSHPVQPPSDYPDRFQPAWDHMILQILNQQGRLGQLFPPSA